MPNVPLFNFARQEWTRSRCASYTSSQSDLDAGRIINTATATGNPPNGPAVSDTDTATVAATTTPAISLTKTATPTTIARAGDTVNYAFVVTNPGNVTLTTVTVTDPKPGISTVSCPATTLAPQGQVTCTATYVTTQNDIDAGVIVNTATVTATTLGGTPVTAANSATVTATATPGISLVKTATPATIGNVGDIVTFRFTTTNTGNVTLAGVAINDPFPGLSAINCPTSDGRLAPGAAITCSATYRVTQTDITSGSIRNTGTVTANSGVSGVAVTNTGTVTVTVAADATLQLIKSVSANSVPDGTTVTYSLVATNIGNVTLTDVTLTDPLPGLSAVTCPGFDRTLDPGQSVTCTATYTARTAAATNGTITNTATATGRTSSGTTAAAQDTAVLTVSGRLPTTGAEIRLLLQLAVILTTAGCFILILTRRRSRTQ